MKRLLFAFSALAILTLSASTASAQGPPPGAGPGYPSGGYPQAYGPIYDGYGGGGYGFGMGGVAHGGFLSGIFTNHGHKYEKRKGFGDDPRNVNTLPVAAGGTLVYPQNPFIRSPRDYFMWDER
jgi:hypothetical protein